MDRRSFIKTVSVGSSIVLSSVDYCFSQSDSDQFKYISITPQDEKSVNRDIPNGKRSPFGWEFLKINPDEKIRFKLKEPITQPNAWVRVSVAQEIWDSKLLHVKIPESDIYLGAIDIRYSSVLVPYELSILPDHFDKINEKGLELTLESKTPLWIFDKVKDIINNEAFLPHIVNSKYQIGRTHDFLDCFKSINSIQAFGWREGCVLDGLWQLYQTEGNSQALKTIRQHLDLFLDKQQNLIFETAHSIPNDNKIDGIESTLPFATIVRIYPDHPILQTVINAWERYQQENGMITDGAMISAEGCYTVAYPMAIIGKSWNKPELLQASIEQLKHRFVLLDSGDFYLRSTNKVRTYRNWGRGAAWFLLGFARTIKELKNEVDTAEVERVFREAIDSAISMQREDGLWSCFMHNQQSLPDTSGSSGISAAILIGIELGILPKDYRTHAERCWATIQNYLTPDGFLCGVAQDNRGGVQLQEGDYRVISQMGMGLMAQLYAAL